MHARSRYFPMLVLIWKTASSGLTHIVLKMSNVRSEFPQFSPEIDEKVESYKKSSVKRQYFATVVMDLLAFSYGATCGWTSSSIPILKSDDTPLETGPISTADASWISSGICIGGFFGNLLIGWVKKLKTFQQFLQSQKCSAFRKNRSKAFTLYRSTASNAWLALDFLRNKSDILNHISSSQWIFRWRLVLNHSILHFWDFWRQSSRNFRLDGCFVLQPWNFLCLCLWRVRWISDNSMANGSINFELSYTFCSSAWFTNFPG